MKQNVKTATCYFISNYFLSDLIYWVYYIYIYMITEPFHLFVGLYMDYIVCLETCTLCLFFLNNTDTQPCFCLSYKRAYIFFSIIQCFPCFRLSYWRAYIFFSIMQCFSLLMFIIIEKHARPVSLFVNINYSIIFVYYHVISVGFAHNTKYWPCWHINQIIISLHWVNFYSVTVGS